jgi:hypothetical protein
MCMDNIVALISVFIDSLANIVEKRGDISRLHHIHEELLIQFDAEDEMCMGTDRTIFKLRQLFELAMQGAQLFTEHDSMEDLLDLAVELSVVRDELAASLDQVTA